MKRPQDWELKTWLYEHHVKGVVLHHVIGGIDGDYIEWELIPSVGASKRVRDYKIRTLVVLAPIASRILTPTDAVKREVATYSVYMHKEAKELAEYERLKRKFEG